MSPTIFAETSFDTEVGSLKSAGPALAATPLAVIAATAVLAAAVAAYAIEETVGN